MQKQKIELKLPANLKFSSLVRHLTEGIFSNAGFSKEWGSRLKLVVDELFMNAVKYGSIEDKSTVHLVLSYNEEMVEFRIEDDGTGAQNISAEELTEIKNNNYYNILKQEIKHRDHFPELLEYVQSRYILSVASSSRKKDVYTSLELLNLIENFKIILTGDDVKNGKPDPEIFIKTADKLNIPCKECAVIEDSQNGINAAKKADMTAIAVPTDYTKTHDFSNANYIFENLSMITTIL